MGNFGLKKLSLACAVATMSTGSLQDDYSANELVLGLMIKMNPRSSPTSQMTSDLSTLEGSEPAKLTGVAAMLARFEAKSKHQTDAEVPKETPLSKELREVRESVQAAKEALRSVNKPAESAQEVQDRAVKLKTVTTSIRNRICSLEANAKGEPSKPDPTPVRQLPAGNASRLQPGVHYDLQKESRDDFLEDCRSSAPEEQEFAKENKKFNYVSQRKIRNSTEEKNQSDTSNKEREYAMQRLTDVLNSIGSDYNIGGDKVADELEIEREPSQSEVQLVQEKAKEVSPDGHEDERGVQSQSEDEDEQDEDASTCTEQNCVMYTRIILLVRIQN